MEQTIVITHSGVRGMKWGVRRQQVRKQNLAARRYFKEDRLERKREKTGNFKKYRDLGKKVRKVKTRRDRLESSMSKADIIAGRARVSRNRVIRNVALSSIAGSAALGIGVAAMAGANRSYSSSHGSVCSNPY